MRRGQTGHNYCAGQGAHLWQKNASQEQAEKRRAQTIAHETSAQKAHSNHECRFKLSLIEQIFCLNARRRYYLLMQLLLTICFVQRSLKKTAAMAYNKSSVSERNSRMENIALLIGCLAIGIGIPLSLITVSVWWYFLN